ncbi:hypothetical protein SAMN05444959_10555 [Paracoccus seriniphilus]|uniref:Uncharacterized protein n=2 Tax=Paracoccus seriniphilus TaxID=184748 RepID=A0A239PT72_9RHOB|nr:hypothetical protein SAMN05444959_10555 [Paracoccus seriniphilus]
MIKSGALAFTASGLLMLVFVVNLILGRNAAPILDPAGEMLILFAAATAFGIGTLIREAQQN